MSLRRVFGFEDRGLEESIFLQAVLISLFAVILLAINAAIHGLIFPLFTFNISVSVILLIFFYLARYRGIYQHLILPFIITMLMLIDLSWFISGGFRGSNGFFLLVLLIISIIITKKEHRIIYTSLFIVNALILYSIEYYNPEITVGFPFEIDIVGQCIILVVCIVTASLIVVNLKNNYDADRIKVTKMNNQLSEQKREIEKKNSELESYSENLRREVDKQTHQLESLNADLKAQNLSHEQFTYILAHNIRSPITQLKGLFNILPKGLAKDELTKETLMRMSAGIMKLDDVISDLSKIVNSRRDNQDLFEEVSISKQLDLALDSLRDQIHDSKARIDDSEVEDISISGISAYVQSILYNLIHNAIKYSSKERLPYIKISVSHQSENVEIRVSDNGIGIDLSQIKDRIFQLYQRFNDDRPGKGFGLFLIKTQVNSMGGEISVESEVGKGTTFTIRIPA